MTLPPFLAENGDTTREGSPTSMDSWELMPGDVEDPRFDRHGFRRDARRLSMRGFRARVPAAVAAAGAALGRKVEKREELSELAHSELKHLARLHPRRAA